MVAKIEREADILCPPAPNSYFHLKVLFIQFQPKLFVHIFAFKLIDESST